ncbi:MAG: hypothetical protein ICV87_00845 [Gemmatimonadetes bacterium]|nr:hypothetical protein [Gemmatimonadota bacterium]
MHRSRILPALAALALALPAAARAQGCIGAPVPEGGRAFQLQGAANTYADAPEIEGPGIGASFRGNPGGILAYSAEYSYASVSDGIPVHGGGAMLAVRAPISVARLAICARGGVMASRFSDSPSATELDNVTFPVGVVVELPLALGEGRALVPYVAPQYLFSRTTGEILGLGYEDTGNAIGVEAGLGVRVRRAAVTVGGNFSELPETLITPAVPRQSLFLRVGVLF